MRFTLEVWQYCWVLRKLQCCLGICNNSSLLIHKNPIATTASWISPRSYTRASLWSTPCCPSRDTPYPWYRTQGQWPHFTKIFPLAESSSNTANEEGDCFPHQLALGTSSVHAATRRTLLTLNHSIIAHMTKAIASKLTRILNEYGELRHIIVKPH